MTTIAPIQLLFDECLGRPHVAALATFVKLAKHEPIINVIHLFDLFPAGTDDSIWIPATAQQGFLLVTADRHQKHSRRKHRDAPLPLLCAQNGLRHVLLGGTASQQKMFDKMLTILSVWHQLPTVAASDPGSRFRLEHVARGVGRLVAKHVSDYRPPAGHLF